MYFPGFKASEQRMDPIHQKWLEGSHEIAFAGDYEAHNLGFGSRANAPIPVRVAATSRDSHGSSGLGPELADMGALMPDAGGTRVFLQLSGEMTHWVMSQSSDCQWALWGQCPRLVS